MTIEPSPRLVSQGPKRRRLAVAGPGIVLECTDRGVLLKKWRDDLGLLHGITPGISFLHLLHRDSLDKAFTFMTELKDRASAFGWELKVSLTRQATTLFVGGTLRYGRLMIYGTRTRTALLGFSRYFMDGSLLRAVDQAIREHLGRAQAQDNRELALHAELSCAQDKLVNLQQVLSRKNASLAQVIAELQEARTGIHNLPSLVPICSSCKKIRDEQGDWNQIENYFKDRIGVQFTHSICPECAHILYPGLRLEK